MLKNNKKKKYNTIRILNSTILFKKIHLYIYIYLKIRCGIITNETSLQMT